MIEQLQHRADTIRQILREYPERGADLLMDFARRFAADPQLEDEVILLKIDLTESKQLDQKKLIIANLFEIISKIEKNYNYIAIQDYIEKENRLSKNIKNISIPDDIVLSAKNIRKRFSSSDFNLSLDHIELRLGQITALVGENATGKTTLFRILSGKIAPDGGMLKYPLFDPQNRLSWVNIKQQIAYVPQELPSWSGSMRDNLRYEASIHGIKGESNKKAVDFIAQRLGLGYHLDKKWSQLSGGYKLRFALAKALIWKVKMLFLDEPLAFLDVKTQLIVLNDIRNLTKSLRNPMTVLISSQHLHEIESVADQMLFMNNGKVENLGQVVNIGKDRSQNIFEFHCSAGYSDLAQHLDRFPYHKIWYDGLSWFVSTPLTITGLDLQQHLFDRGLVVDFYRDLSHSVKTKFYAEHL